MMQRQRLLLALGWAAALAALLAVFSLYAHPQTMVALADLMWACFN